MLGDYDMKEIDCDVFLDNYDENIETLHKTGEVWLLTHNGQKNLVVMHKDTYERMFKVR